MGPDLLIALVVVLVIVLIWQGPKNLPKLGQALGRSIKDFRTEVGSNDEPASPSTAATTPTTTTTTTTTPPPTPPTPPTPPKDEPAP